VRQEMIEKMARSLHNSLPIEGEYLPWDDELGEEAKAILRDSAADALDALLDGLEEHPDLFDVNFPYTVEGLAEMLRGES
jgi:hypothetical protein